MHEMLVWERPWGSREGCWCRSRGFVVLRSAKDVYIHCRLTITCFSFVIYHDLFTYYFQISHFFGGWENLRSSVRKFELKVTSDERYHVILTKVWRSR